MITISSNLMALNAENNLNITNAKRVKTTEKLSSGYRINRAADDAAGLAISEKMRRQIRGLNQGTANGMDGISWCQTGDGSLDEAHDIMHRMHELTVKSLNETNTDEDRLYMEMEFDALQSELDRIGKSTQFNEINIFQGHYTPYYQCQGGVKWDPQQMHAVTAGSNDLVFEYRMKETDAPQTLTVTVPPGEYTTQELVDEIESALVQSGKADNIMLELTDTGFCNANLEGGEIIDAVTGGLSYLLYNMYQGGGSGALIGTTTFHDENSKLEIEPGQNNELIFTLERFDGTAVPPVKINLLKGEYTREKLIEALNIQLQGTTVKAEACGTGIKLSSPDGIVTGFKGNMFKIDEGGKIYHSVFYDNVKYGNVNKTAGYFVGGSVLPLDSRDVEHQKYEIDSSNNILTFLKPNGSANDVTITILPEGKYTAAEMAGKLNELFGPAGLELEARVNSENGFQGITILSKEEGLDSVVSPDPSCSAYDTLFVTREYNQYGYRVQPDNETRANRDGYYIGGRTLTAPFTVTAGTNDSFDVYIDGTSYPVQMSARTYNSVEEIRAELDRQLNDNNAPAGCRGKLNVTLSGGRLSLTGADGGGVNVVRVNAQSGNKGEAEFFNGTQVSYRTRPASGYGNVTLNTPFTGSNKDPNMNISFGGKNYPVTLPTGDNVSQKEIIDAIEAAIPPRTETTPNTFNTVYDEGRTVDNTAVQTASGTSNVSPWGDSAQGVCQEKEGDIGVFIKNEPATLTIQPMLKDRITLDDTNNRMDLTINGNTQTIILQAGVEYDKDSLKEELQRQIDNTFGTGMGGANVEFDPSGNHFVLEARLPAGEKGSNTNISCSTNTSSFLAELNTTRQPAVWRSSTELASQIVIGGGQTLNFQYTEKGESREIKIPLSQGTYDRDSIITELNRKLVGQGLTASRSGNRLVMTSDAAGSDVSISFSIASGGSAAEQLFGPGTKNTPADIVVNRKTENVISIKPGDTFTVMLNGVPRTVTFTEGGDWSRSTFVQKLNEKLQGAGIGVEAYVSGDQLGYRTTATGSGVNISMSYDNGGTSMKAIYGETRTEYPGVKASFDSQNRLVLSSTGGRPYIYVSSSTGGVFQQSVPVTQQLYPDYRDGYHSAKKSNIDGVSLIEPIPVDEWNDNLKFTFGDAGTSKNVEVKIPYAAAPDNYTFAKLEKELQGQIDTQVGAGKIQVTVDGNGVRLEASKAGSSYSFSSFSGDFYDKVICSCTEQSIDRDTDDKKGTQTGSAAFTVGRKDVKNNVTEIHRNINDTLSLELVYGGQPHKLEMKLDAGNYTGEKLQAHVQDKINEQLKASGLEENLIQVGLGDIKTNVSGANDENALNFKLAVDSVKAPAKGQFIIEGVSGSAAFEIFYQTDGKLMPAHIRGTKDISQGVDIGPDETELNFDVDGTVYPIPVPEGHHTAEELLQIMNDAFGTKGIPLTAEMEDGMLKVSYTKMGEHTINVVPGGAKKKVFFAEEGNKDELVRSVKLSAQEDDKVELDQPPFNTSLLRINSICISKVKYARKAAERLQGALSMISDIRSGFGSTQNRLEYALNNNRNVSENTQSAESRIRDTDMTGEMVQLSNQNILSQAGTAMLAQANVRKEWLMQLLQ